MTDGHQLPLVTTRPQGNGAWGLL